MASVSLSTVGTTSQTASGTINLASVGLANTLSIPINVAYGGTLSSVAVGTLIGTSPVTVTLPGTPVQGAFIQNLSAVAHTLLTVTWTPQGGASAAIQVLAPSGVLFFLNPTTETGGGISALSLVASAASTPVQYLLIA